MTRIFVHRDRFHTEDMLDAMEAWLRDRCGDTFSAIFVEDGRHPLGVLFRIPMRALALQFRDTFA